MEIYQFISTYWHAATASAQFDLLVKAEWTYNKVIMILLLLSGI